MNGPDRLGAKYERRGKFAALTSVGLLAVGAAKFDMVPAADAAIERSDRQEEKSPSAMVADINSRIVKMIQRIKSEPNVQKVSWKDMATDKNMTTYVLQSNSARNPKNSDYLLIAIDKKTGSPTEFEYHTDVPKVQPATAKASKKRSYSINHRTLYGYNPKVVELDISTESSYETYRVGQRRETLPGSDYVVPGTVEYLDNPAAVTQRVNYVFKQADNMLRKNR